MMETRTVPQVCKAEVVVEVEQQPPVDHVQVMLVDGGIVIVPGSVYRKFFAFRPEDIRFYSFADHPECHWLYWRGSNGIEWDMSQVRAFVRQEV